ncbi:hypothetical protein ABPG75_005559 [Micractinium tetrahymenae]
MLPEDEGAGAGWPAGAAHDGGAAPAAVPAAGTAGRQQRASAAKANAQVNTWHDAETAPFTAVVGSDLFVTARHRAVGEARRERERQRDEAAGGGGSGGTRPRRSVAAHPHPAGSFAYGYSPEDEEEESEEDAGARDDDSEEESGRRRGRGGSTRRRGARRWPQETVASGRPKRQRHSRAVDPDMLDTDAALDAAFGGGQGWAAARTGAAEAPRTRSRATPPVGLPTAFAADEVAAPAATTAAVAAAPAATVLPALPPLLPIVLPGMGLTAPQPTAPRRGAGMSAAALRAARTPSPAALAAAVSPAQAAEAAAAPAAAPALAAVDAGAGQPAAPALAHMASAAVPAHGGAVAAATTAAEAENVPPPVPAAAAQPAAAAAPAGAAPAVDAPSADLPVALPSLPLPAMPPAALSAGTAAATAALPILPLPPVPAATTMSGCLPTLPVVPFAVPLPAAPPLTGAGAAASMVLPVAPTSFAAAAAFQAAQQAAPAMPAAMDATTAEVAAAGKQPQLASQPAPAPAAPATAVEQQVQPLPAAAEAPAAAAVAMEAASAAPAVQAVHRAPAAGRAAAGLAAALPLAPAEPAAIKQEQLAAPAAVQQASALPAWTAEAVAAALPPRWAASVVGAAAPTPAPAWPAAMPAVRPSAGGDGGGGSGRTPVDVLYGCAKCRYLRGGCNTCRAREPAFTRPRMRWKPAQGHYQIGIESAPVFRPTPEEFKDPIAYISKIKPQAEKYGLAHIVPPPGWDPPFALEKGTNGLSMESFRFAVRKQYTSHLCRRAGRAPPAPGTPPQEAAPASAAAEGRCTGRMSSSLRGAGDGAAGAAQQQPASPCQAQQQQQQPAPLQQGLQQQPTLPPEQRGQQGPGPMRLDRSGGDAASLRSPVAVNNGSEEAPAPVPEFGFPHLEKKHTLRSFSAYADWVKEIHFSDPLPATPNARSSSASARSARCSQRRPRALPNYGTLPEPTVEQIEAEFWRIVESPEERVESLYGQDVDSGHHGSGFPLPLWRRRLLEQHLARQAAAAGSGGAPAELPNYADELERQYAEHPWNINNLPRCPNSVLRYLPGTDGELITGVMVPWLYVGSVLSAFCWHVEDHALCSINYHHMGAPKVWYGVPASATAALEEAVRDALPHLFAGNPRLMYQLVTALSPMELKKRGVPVYRVVHEPGSFVVTMPDAYHSGFNCGFNVAEAVNFAPSHWIPYGTDVAEKYRTTGKPLTLSHDALMVTLVKAAEHKPVSQSCADPAGADAIPAAAPALGGAGGDPQQQAQQQAQQQLQDGAAAEPAVGWAAAAPGLPLPWEQPPPRSRSRGGAAAAQAPTLSPLGPAPLENAPLEGIALAAGELSLRAAEERRRRMVAFVVVGALPERRMATDAPPGSKDAQGVHANTADCDCAQCNGDLWLSAVVSTAAPGVAVCPEHAEALVRRHGCLRDSLALLYRHSPQELDAMVALAVQRVPGAAGAVAAARQRRGRIEAARVRARPAGPMYEMLAPGQPAGALPIPVDGDDCCDSEEEDSSDDDWEAAAERARKGGGSGRGAAKRRRSAGAKRQRASNAGGGGMRMAMAGGGGAHGRRQAGAHGRRRLSATAGGAGPGACRRCCHPRQRCGPWGPAGAASRSSGTL